jgi:soluble lytic murein transglycosylase-like protein
MPQFLRAIALALTMLIAHITHAPAHALRTHGPHASSHLGAAALARLQRAEALIALQQAPPVQVHTVPVAARLPSSGAAPAPHYSGSIAAIIQQAFAPLGSAAVSWAERVAMCESGDNPNARNADGAAGLFQFMPSTWAGTPWARSSVFDPVANARAAAWLYARRGRSAWSCG